jgi:hypothetical protein
MMVVPQQKMHLDFSQPPTVQNGGEGTIEADTPSLKQGAHVLEADTVQHYRPQDQASAVGDNRPEIRSLPLPQAPDGDDPTFHTGMSSIAADADIDLRCYEELDMEDGPESPMDAVARNNICDDDDSNLRCYEEWKIDKDTYTFFQEASTALCDSEAEEMLLRAIKDHLVRAQISRREMVQLSTAAAIPGNRHVQCADTA